MARMNSGSTEEARHAALYSHFPQYFKPQLPDALFDIKSCQWCCCCCCCSATSSKRSNAARCQSSLHSSFSRNFGFKGSTTCFSLTLLFATHRYQTSSSCHNGFNCTESDKATSPLEGRVTPSINLSTVAVCSYQRSKPIPRTKSSQAFDCLTRVVFSCWGCHRYDMMCH